MDAEESHALDLPLMSNIKDILVHHYVLDLTCDFKSKSFTGSITLFCKPSKKTTEIRNDRQDNLDKTVIESNNSMKTTCSETSGGDSICANSSLLGNSNIDTNARHTTNSKCTNDLKYSKWSDLSKETHQEHGGKYGLFEHNYSKDESECEMQACSNETSKNSSSLSDSLSAGGSDNGNCGHKYKGASDILEEYTCKQNEWNFPSYNECLKKKCTHVVMTLDAWDLEVECVHKLHISSSELSQSCSNGAVSNMDRNQLYDCLKSAKTHPLCYLAEKKSIKIWDKSVSEWEKFPEVIRIQYKTCPHGPSLKWTQDQDGRECVYTHGHWINNRSLFPSQDVPVAMATWAAYIHVPADLVVLMSGDKNPVIFLGKEGTSYSTYHYYTNMVMPSSTLALAVGSWQQTDIITEQQETSYRDEGLSVLPCRLFSPYTLSETAQVLLQDYLPRCMEGAKWLLGSHPFSRLDILIVPRSFASLGMASPSLMFLSQSVISPDGGMLVRVAHELSHSWFGLLIGPRDWHEEWLSEGFCTYTEGVIHARAMQWSAKEAKDHAELQDYFKYRTLEAEVTNTQQELQTLRHRDKTNKDENLTHVKNGMNPEKGFMQVHYLKGYFLLRFLEAEVGHTKFRSFLYSLVNTFHHQLITSTDVLNLFFQTFSAELSDKVTENKLASWLDDPGIPRGLQRPNLEEIFLAKEAIKAVEHINMFNKSFSKLHWRKKRKFDLENSIKLPQLENDQVLLLLELLLDEQKIHPEILQNLKTQLNIETSNPDARHRWCELIIKYKVESCYNDVSDFLINHQAMGVYLFGELMVTRDQVQRKLAATTFDLLKAEMEEGIRATVQAMVYGT